MYESIVDLQSDPSASQTQLPAPAHPALDVQDTGDALEDPMQVLPPDVHAMYTSSSLTHVPSEPVPEGLRRLMPNDSMLSQLGAFHLQLLVAYTGALPFCSQTVGL